MDITPLEDLGLTNAEIKVYLTLLELGQTKVGPIIEKSDLQSSVVHNALHKLQDKGLISYIKKGQIKHYKATDPKNFMDFIEEKKK
ncbi:helix-turn-helix domain-containing protein, partial [Candidatus Woesearchaeota archaeon]|nr:helix-turn-helix domain-containing protein [Candidatus Woesearchaeota archaeon]